MVAFGSFIPDASAKFILGKALCNPSPEAVKEASVYNTFAVGQKVDLSPAAGLTRVMLSEKAVGRVHEKTVNAGFNFDNYLKIRGLDSTAGKTFEKSFGQSFNNMMTRRNQNFFIESTALLGNPHDSADLLVINRTTNRVELRIQQKLSASLAMDAVTNPQNMKKYKDCNYILTTPDQLEYIKQHLPKNLVKRKAIEDALASGRLTDRILGVQAESMNFYRKAANNLYKPTFNKMSKSMLLVNIKRTLFFIIDKSSTETIQDLLPFFKAIPLKAFSTASDVSFSLCDIGYGVYLVYNAQSQFEKGLLDSDLSDYKKLLGVVQIGFGVLGLVAAFSPDPFSKVAAPIIVMAVGVLVAALDMWIDHIQTQRIAARQRLMERVAAQDRPRAIRELLIKDMNIHCVL